MIKNVFVLFFALLLSGMVVASHQNLIRPADNPQNVQPKLRYLFYQGDWNHLPDFSTLEPSHVGEISRPYLKIFGARDHFAVQFTGYLRIHRDGVYTFYSLSDAGSALWIGDQVVVNNDGLHAERERSGEILLRKGLHRITINYFDKSGDEILKIYYSGPGFHKTFLSPNNLFHEDGRPAVRARSTIPGLIASFYSGPFYGASEDHWYSQKIVAGEPKAVDIVDEPTLKLNVLKANRLGLLQFKGFIEVTRPGLYLFYFDADRDGAMWVSDRQIIDNDKSYNPKRRVGYIPLMAGKHKVRINYFETGKGKRLNLQYRGPILAKQAIPNKRPIPDQFWSYNASFHSPDNDNTWEFETLYEDIH